MSSNPSLHQKTWRVIDQTQTSASLTALYSFAMDDTLMGAVGGHASPPVARAWVHDHHVVLGSRDYRLPNAELAIRQLKNAGYEVIVRNSGGTAVMLDKGVFNLSLILPTAELFTRIDSGYQLMAELVETMLAPLGESIKTGEIHGSYCPGRYDLSIGGKKFGGIAQRRGKGGMAVQAFLLAEGSGRERADIIRSFYNCAALNTQQDYPEVIPDTMASLSELTHQPVNANWLFRRLVEVLKANAQNVTFSQLYERELESFNQNIKAMALRQERWKQPHE